MKCSHFGNIGLKLEKIIKLFKPARGDSYGCTKGYNRIPIIITETSD